MVSIAMITESRTSVTLAYVDYQATVADVH